MEQSALVEHVQQTGHTISWENMRPVIKENRWCQRRWNEACMIFKTKNVIVNRDCRKVLPDVYRSLIDQLWARLIVRLILIVYVLFTK